MDKERLLESLNRAYAAQERESQAENDRLVKSIRNFTDKNSSWTTPDGEWRIKDGDTFTHVKSGEDVRLDLSQMPEIAHHFANKHDDEFGGQYAKQFLYDTFANNSGKITYTRHGKDSTGKRTVGKLFIDGADFDDYAIRNHIGRYAKKFDKEGELANAAYEASQTMPAEHLKAKYNDYELQAAIAGNKDVTRATRGGNTFGRSLGRGTDQSLAALARGVSVFGKLLGSDPIAKWGEEKATERLINGLKNPPKIDKWDDVHTLSQFGTFFLEALGENLPQFGIDGALAVGTGGAATAARAMYGKAIGQALAEQGLGTFFKRAAKAGGVGALYTEAVGETDLELAGQGINAPKTSAIAGVPAAALDLFGLKAMFEPFFKAASRHHKAGTLTMRKVAQLASLHGVAGILSEGATEGFQTYIGKLAAEIEGGEDALSSSAWEEYRTAIAKGGIVGGSVATSAALLANLRQNSGQKIINDADRAHKQMDKVEDADEDNLDEGFGTETTATQTETKQPESGTKQPETEETSTKSEEPPLFDEGDLTPASKAHYARMKKKQREQDEAQSLGEQPPHPAEQVAQQQPPHPAEQVTQQEQQPQIPQPTEQDQENLQQNKQKLRQTTEKRDRGTLRDFFEEPGIQSIDFFKGTKERIAQQKESFWELYREDPDHKTKVDKVLQRADNFAKGQIRKWVPSVFSPAEVAKVRGQSVEEFNAWLAPKNPKSESRGSIAQTLPHYEHTFEDEPEIQTLGEPQQAVERHTDDLVYAPNGEPYPYVSAAESEGRKRMSGEFSVLPVEDGYALISEESTDGHNTESERPESTAGQTTEEISGSAEQGGKERGAVERSAIQETITEGAKEWREADDGEAEREREESWADSPSGIIVRLREEGLELPIISDAKYKSLFGESGDADKDAVTYALIQQAKDLIEGYGFTLKQGLQFLYARELIEAIDRANLDVIEYIEAESETSDASDEETDETTSKAFSDGLSFSRGDEHSEDLDTEYNIRSWFKPSSHHKPSSHESVQQSYLDEANALFPTMEWYLVDKPDPATGRDFYFLAALRKRDGTVLPEKKLYYKTLGYSKRLFSTESQAKKSAAGLQKRFSLYSFRVVPQGGQFVVERYNHEKIRKHEASKIEAFVDAFVAKAKRLASTSRGSSQEQNGKILSFWTYSDKTGEISNTEKPLLFHAPTITELGRKLNPYIEPTRFMLEKQYLWFNYGISALVQHGYYSPSLENLDFVDSVVFTPTKSGLTIGQFKEQAEAVAQAWSTVNRLNSRINYESRREVSAKKSKNYDAATDASRLRRRYVGAKIKAENEARKLQEAFSNLKMVDEDWVSEKQEEPQFSGDTGRAQDKFLAADEAGKKKLVSADTKPEYQSSEKTSRGVLPPTQAKVSGQLSEDPDAIRELLDEIEPINQRLAHIKAGIVKPQKGEVAKLKAKRLRLRQPILKYYRDLENDPSVDSRPVVSPELPLDQQSSLTLEERDGFTEKEPREFDPLNIGALNAIPRHEGKTPIDLVAADFEASTKQGKKIRKRELLKQGIDFTKGSLQIAGKTITNLERQFVRGALKSIGVDMNVLVVDRTWYANNKAILPNHPAPDFGAGVYATFIPFDGVAVIVLADTNTAGKTHIKNQRANRLYFLAHELGHALEDHIIRNLSDSEKQKLKQAYRNYRQTEGDFDFTEWFADKVGAFLIDRSQKPENFVLRMAKKVAEFIRQYLLNASRQLKNRFAQDKTVSEILDGMIADRRLQGKVIPQKGTPKNITVHPKNQMQATRLSRAISKGIDTMKLAWKCGTFLWTADRQLRDLGDRATILAQIFHLDPAEAPVLLNLVDGHTLKGPFLFRVMQHRGRLWNELGDIEADGVKFSELFAKKSRFTPYNTVKPEYEDDVARGLQELYDSVDKPKSKYARMVREYLEQFYSGYLKEKIPTIGYLKNYFPRILDTLQLSNYRGDIREIMVRHKFDQAQEEVRARITRDSAGTVAPVLMKDIERQVDMVLDHIEKGGGIQELALLLEDQNPGPGFTARRARDFFDNDAMVKELSDKNFMERDAAKVMFNYIASAVKRAEFEDTFGGYVNLTGMLNVDDINEFDDLSEGEIGQFKATYQTLLKQYAWHIAGLEFGETESRLGFRRAIELYSKALNQGNTEFADAIRADIKNWEDGLTNKDHEQWYIVRDWLDHFKENRIGLAKKMSEVLRDSGHIRWDGDNLGIYSPNEGLTRHFQAIHDESGDHAMRAAQKIIRGYMGQLGTDMPREVQHAMSTMMAYQSVLVLMFSTLSSFPDIVGGILRNRDASGMWRALGSTMQAVSWKFFDGDKYQHLVNQAHDIGLIGQRISQQVLQEMVGTTYTSEGAQKALDYLFHWNLQEKWTDYTRIVNLHVAKTSVARWVGLAEAGDKRAMKYLKEIGLNAETYRRWDGEAVSLKDQASGKFSQQTLDDRQAVQDAFVRFVEESVVRPNPAHRPTWASDPRFMLIWHLKSFFYSYGKIVILPFMKALGSAISEAGEGKKGLDKVILYGQAVGAQAIPLLLAGVMLMGLAAFGWELKEKLQYNLFGKKPRSDDMGAAEYNLELLQRAGVAGGFQIGMDAFWGYGDFDRRSANLLGSTMDWLRTWLDTEVSFKGKLYRSTPVVNQLPGLKTILGQ